MNARIMRRIMPVVVLLFGCSDGNGPNDVGDGEFEFTITGDVDRTVSGDAFYVVGEDAGEESISIVLSDEEEGFILARAGATVPAVGTYNITTGLDAGPNDFFVSGFFRAGSSLSHLCESGSASDTGGPVWGTVTITESGSNLAGTFTTTVGCLNYGTGAVTDATVTGSFDAQQLEPGDVP